MARYLQKISLRPYADTEIWTGWELEGRTGEIEGLILALQRFEGTLVFISHDVHFIKLLATKVLHINAGKVTPYAGGYDYYLEKSGMADQERAAVVAG